MPQSTSWFFLETFDDNNGISLETFFMYNRFMHIYVYVVTFGFSWFFFSLSIKKWSGWWVWGIHDRFHDFNILIMMHSSHEHKIYILVRTTIHMTHTPHKPPSQSRPSHGFCSKSVLAKSVLVSTCDGLLSTVRGAFITCRRGSPKHLIKILYDQHVQKIKRRNIYIYVITVEARTRTGLRKMIERIFFFFLVIYLIRSGRRV